MGKPTISKYGANSYVDGTDLIINDANMLSEVAGNIENRVNVQSYHNILTFNYYWRKQNDVSYTIGQESLVAIVRIPRSFTVLQADFIGYCGDGAAGINFKDGQNNAGSNNVVTGKIEVKNDLGESEIFSYGGTVMNNISTEIEVANKIMSMGNIAGSSPLNLTIGKFNYLYVSCKVKSGANAAFEPLIQVTLTCKEEHGT